MESMDVKDVALALGSGVVGVLIVCLVASIIGVDQTLKVLACEYAVGFLLGLCFYIIKRTKSSEDEDENEDE